MLPRLTTQEERKQIYLEALINKTTKVTKVSDNSVLGGHAAGVSRVAGKAEKDIALAISHMFPDSSYGQYLDNIASNWGIAPRFAASGSSTYILLIANPNTQYFRDVHTFSTPQGISFQLDKDVQVGNSGYGYAKVRSIDVGFKTKVESFAINQVSPQPEGHIAVYNEYIADGGRDAESDDTFRKRIKEGPNILATNTLSAIEQAFIKINPNILRIFYQGINNKGQVILAIATQNGADLTLTELDDIITRSGEFLSLSELKPYGSKSYGVQLKNIEYQPIDISYRVSLSSDINPDVYRKNVQLKMSKYLDFRFWESGEKNVEWDDLLGIAKRTAGAKYVPDQHFNPGQDVATDPNKLPRIRGFRIYDLDGNIISDISGVLNPVFFPNQVNESFQSTILTSI